MQLKVSSQYGKIENYNWIMPLKKRLRKLYTYPYSHDRILTSNDAMVPIPPPASDSYFENIL